jgi:hypothetical protein
VARDAGPEAEAIEALGTDEGDGRVDQRSRQVAVVVLAS